MKSFAIVKNAPHDVISRSVVTGGRMLILFSSLLVALMPITEYFWHFDHFLRGGEDFEFWLLAFTTILCLVLVFVKDRECTTQRFFDFAEELPAFLSGLLSAAFASFSSQLSPGDSSGRAPGLAIYNLPIQI